MLNRNLLTVADENINMFPGYSRYPSIRERRRGGGVSVFINSKFESNQLHDHSFNYVFLESVCVNVNKGSNGYVLAFYDRQPVDSLY